MTTATFVWAAFGWAAFVWAEFVCVAGAAGADVVRVLPKGEGPHMLARYFAAKATTLTAASRERWPAGRVAHEAAAMRAALWATYGAPPDAPGPVEGHTVGVSTVDGVEVERRVVKTRPGMFVPCNVFRLPRPRGKSPALLLLPGHGDLLWAGEMQERGLSFAKAGYVVCAVEPYGQAERGMIPAGSVVHSDMAAGMLIAAGEGLLGEIMYDHRRVIDDLLARPDVDGDRLGVTGVSMGGTHAMWLAAVDLRVKAVVADAAHEFNQAHQPHRHHCLCDTMIGQFAFGDEQTIDALIAPRPFLRIYPSVQRPVSLADERKYVVGDFPGDPLLNGAAPLDETKIVDERFPYLRDVYAAQQHRERLAVAVVEGPHAYTKPMREAATRWLNDALQPGVPFAGEPPLAPVADPAAARRAFNAWPGGGRPADALDPHQYTADLVRRKIERLPAAPATPDVWRAMKQAIRDEVRRAAGQRDAAPAARVASETSVERDGVRETRVVLETEPGISVPLVVRRKATDERVARTGTVVWVSPEGLATTADSPLAASLVAGGWTVACVDLRGTGETRSKLDDASYLGFRDYDVCVAALKIGETLAGGWALDLSATLAHAEVNGGGRPLHLLADRETGFAAALVMMGKPTLLRSVVLRGMMSSYQCPPGGYGGYYVYADANDIKPDRQYTTSFGSGVPWIPRVLDIADVPQALATLAPTRLLVTDAVKPDGAPEDVPTAFAWTTRAYAHEGAGSFRVAPKLSDEELSRWFADTSNGTDE